MMSELRPIAQDLIKRVDDFIQNEIAHNENLYHEQSKDENGTWVKCCLTSNSPALITPSRRAFTKARQLL